MIEEFAVFEAYSLIYEHHYASGFMVARDAFTESIGNTVPVVDEKDRDTIIGKAILSSDDKGLIANVTLFNISELTNESVCLDTFVTYEEEPKRNQTGPAIITKGKARGIIIHHAGTIPEHPSVKVKSLDDTLRPCWCGGKRSIRCISEGTGMDGCYTDWIVECEDCHAKWNLPADNFYGRKPMTKVEVIEKMNKLVSINVIASEGYDDGYYWDYRFWFTYEGQPYTYINSGSGSGYYYNHEEIAKGLLDLQKGARMEEYSSKPELDIDRIVEAIAELEKCGKDWYVIYADDGREKEDTWLMKDEKEEL